MAYFLMRLLSFVGQKKGANRGIRALNLEIDGAGLIQPARLPSGYSCRGYSSPSSTPS